MKTFLVPLDGSGLAEQVLSEVLIDEGAHGYGGLRRWAMGSVADVVLHTTTTPLILVRAQLQH
jgi:hypothetical protein